MVAKTLFRSVLLTAVLLGVSVTSYSWEGVIGGKDIIRVSHASPLLSFQPAGNRNATQGWNQTFTNVPNEDFKPGKAADGYGYHFTVVDKESANNTNNNVYLNVTYSGWDISINGYWGSREHPDGGTVTLEVYDAQSKLQWSGKCGGPWNRLDYAANKQEVSLCSTKLERPGNYTAVVTPTEGALGITNIEYKPSKPPGVRDDVPYPGAYKNMGATQPSGGEIEPNPDFPFQYSGNWVARTSYGIDGEEREHRMGSSDPSATATFVTGLDVYSLAIYGMAGPDSANYSISVIKEEGGGIGMPPIYRTVNAYSDWAVGNVLLFATRLNPDSSYKVVMSRDPASTSDTEKWLDIVRMEMDVPMPKFKKKPSIGAIVGATVGGVLGAAAIVAVIFILCRRRRARRGPTVPSKKWAFGFRTNNDSGSEVEDKFNVDGADCVATPFVSGSPYDAGTPNAHDGGYADSYFESQPRTTSSGQRGGDSFTKVAPGRWEGQQQQRVVVTTERDGGAFHQPGVIHETLPPTYDPSWDATPGAGASSSVGGEQSAPGDSYPPSTLMSDYKHRLPQD